LFRLPSDLRECFARSEDLLAGAHSYVQRWLQYQALWDMDIEAVARSLGNDLAKVIVLVPCCNRAFILFPFILQWDQLLVDMKTARATTFDTSATQRNFGPVHIDFAGVQAKVRVCLAMPRLSILPCAGKSEVRRLGEVAAKPHV